MSVAYPSPSVTTASEPPSSARRYVPELDGLRAIAVLLVILFHSNPDGPFEGGWIGCDIFFVLSAFLITSILVEEREKTGRIRYGQFYWRRCIRLFPALIVFLAAYVAVAPIFLPGYPHLRDALIAGFYLSNFAIVIAHIPVMITHTWSLAAEEQFYLIWPATLILIARVKRPVLILGAVWLGLTVLRFTTDDWVARYYGPATHGTGLVLGAILYFLVREGRLSIRPIHAAAAFGLLAALSMYAQIGAPELAITVTELIAALIIGAIVSNPGSMRFLATRYLVGLGKISYGLYLWHYPISRIVRGVGSYWAEFTLTFSLSLALACLSYFTVESWARRLRGSIKPTGLSTAQAVA
ncbi:MAG TPA: acyltransferase [Sphingomicrobium sp.]|jgi:peptidoglycan/LPS O-acetylase OafA/YrhL|nr:acyltransferase [Sphingomicrobium sp.]